MTPLYLLRHGPTRASASGAPLGRLDLPVDEDGEARWPALKASLLALPVQRVFCSPLRRSRRHAEDLGLPCEVLEGLQEQAFGEWEGRPWADLAKEDPARAAAFFADPVGAAPPGGESFAACAARAIASMEAHLSPGAPPALVLAHGGPLRALLARLLDLPLARALDLAWEPFGLSHVKVYGPGRGLLAFHNALPECSSHGLLVD